MRSAERHGPRQYKRAPHINAQHVDEQPSTGTLIDYVENILRKTGGALYRADKRGCETVRLLNGWLSGGRERPARDALTVTLMLRDWQVASLIPGIVTWIGNEELLPHILRTLGMLSRENLEPALVHSMRAHLNKLQNNEDLFIDACRKVLHHLNLADLAPTLTTEEFASGDPPAPPDDPGARMPSELPQTLSRSATQAQIALSILDLAKNRPDLPALLHLWLTSCDLDKYMTALRVMQFLPEGILEDLLPDLAAWGDTDRAYPYVRNILGALTPEVLQNIFCPAILRELARTSSWSDHDRSWWMYATLLDSIRMIDEAWNLIYVARLHPQAKVREMADELTEHLDDES